MDTFHCFSFLKLKRFIIFAAGNPIMKNHSEEWKYIKHL